MSWYRSGAALGCALLLGVALGPQASRVDARSPAATATARPSQSVHGRLERVDQSLNGVIMKSDDGKRLAWRFDKAVIAEAAQFKPGDPVVVIYRQIGGGDKAVTALAFPGATSTPVYVNMTGRRVLLRSGPAVDGACGAPAAGPINEYPIGTGSLTEISDACWCCAPEGETCTPANRSGLGRAFLVRCTQ